MEEENYTAYDLEETPQQTPPQPSPQGEGAEVSDQSSEVSDERSEVRDQSSEVRDQSSEVSDERSEVRDQSPENAEGSENAESSEISPAEAEIQRMVKDMGAEKVLHLIRDNRNAAISQLLTEIRESPRPPLPSGSSAASRCSSIFDLAAQA